jgi:putative mRNA 3-end processing factor
MVEATERGLYCAAGDFYIDPHRRVERAVITHAHSDHAHRGMGHYLAHHHTVPLLQHRLGKNISAQGVEYGEAIMMNDVKVSLHPAGHVAGSSQIRIEHHGEVWVVTGDYKRQTDPVSAPFEPVRCHTFITESTFGLPVYQWPAPDDVMQQVNAWWRANASHGHVSLIRAYALGKAQRLLSLVDTSIGPIYVGRSIFEINAVLRRIGISLPKAEPVEFTRPSDLKGAMVITSTNIDEYVDDIVHTAEASGWMAVRRHHRSGGANFIVSDHVDWPDLLRTIKETEAERVLAVHGFTEPLTRYLTEQGLDASPLEGASARGNDRRQRNALSSIAEKKRAEVCEASGLPHWLFDECFDHVRSLSETSSLILHGTYTPTTRSTPKTTVEEPPDVALGRTTLKAVLYHLHRQPGSSRLAKLTMGVWSDADDAEIVPACSC